MKTCYKCKTEKPFVDFYNSKSTRDGRVGMCKKCERAYSLHRYATDPEFAEKKRGYSRYARTKTLGRVRVMLQSVRVSAAKRGLPFILIKSDIESRLDAQDWKCARTGIPFDLGVGKKRVPFGPTVDRIDNDRGYEPGNIQIVCNVYNLAKNGFTDEAVMILPKH